MSLLALSLHQPIPAPSSRRASPRSSCPTSPPTTRPSSAGCRRASARRLLISWRSAGTTARRRTPSGVSSRGARSFAEAEPQATTNRPARTAGLTVTARCRSGGGGGGGSAAAQQPRAAVGVARRPNPGYSECAHLVRRMLRELPSWAKFERSAGTGAGSAPRRAGGARRLTRRSRPRRRGSPRRALVAGVFARGHAQPRLAARASAAELHVAASLLPSIGGHPANTPDVAQTTPAATGMGAADFGGVGGGCALDAASSRQQSPPPPPPIPFDRLPPMPPPPPPPRAPAIPAPTTSGRSGGSSVAGLYADNFS